MSLILWTTKACATRDARDISRFALGGREGNGDSTGCSANYTHKGMFMLCTEMPQSHLWADHFCFISFFKQLIKTTMAVGNFCVKMLIESMQVCTPWWHVRKASVAHYDAVLAHLFDKEQIFRLSCPILGTMRGLRARRLTLPAHRGRWLGALRNARREDEMRRPDARGSMDGGRARRRSRRRGRRDNSTTTHYAHVVR